MKEIIDIFEHNFGNVESRLELVYQDIERSDSREITMGYEYYVERIRRQEIILDSTIGDWNLKISVLGHSLYMKCTTDSEVEGRRRSYDDCNDIESKMHESWESIGDYLKDTELFFKKLCNPEFLEKIIALYLENPVTRAYDHRVWSRGEHDYFKGGTSIGCFSARIKSTKKVQKLQERNDKFNAQIEQAAREIGQAKEHLSSAFEGDLSELQIADLDGLQETILGEVSPPYEPQPTINFKDDHEIAYQLVRDWQEILFARIEKVMPAERRVFWDSVLKAG